MSGLNEFRSAQPDKLHPRVVEVLLPMAIIVRLQKMGEDTRGLEKDTHSSFF